MISRPTIYNLKPLHLLVPQMPRHVHGLMKDPDNKNCILIDLVECHMPPDNQSPGAHQEVRTVRPHPWIVNQPTQGAVDVVQVRVRLTRAPFPESLGPDVDKVGLRRFAQLDFKHLACRIEHAPHV